MTALAYNSSVDGNDFADPDWHRHGSLLRLRISTDVESEFHGTSVTMRVESAKHVARSWRLLAGRRVRRRTELSATDHCTSSRPLTAATLRSNPKTPTRSPNGFPFGTPDAELIPAPGGLQALCDISSEGSIENCADFRPDFMGDGPQETGLL